MFFCQLETTGYYFSVLTLLVLLWSGRLRRPAGAGMLVALVTFVLPAEYGVDPQVTRLVDQLTLDASEFRLGQVTSSVQIPKVQQQILWVSRRTGIFAIPGPYLQRDKDHGQQEQGRKTVRNRRIQNVLPDSVRNSRHWAIPAKV